MPGLNEISNNGVGSVLKLVGVPAIMTCLKIESCRTMTGVLGTAIALQAAKLMQENPGMSETVANTIAVTDLSIYGLAGKPATSLPGTLPTTTSGTPVQTENTTGGNQTVNPSANTTGTGYGAGVQPVFDPLTMAVPPGLLGSDGKLLPGINGTGTPIPMPPTSNPNQTAEDFARNAFNGQIPTSVKNDLVGPGSWLATLPDGTTVLYRPAGQATRTDSNTANVDISSSDIRSLNGDLPAKFKFPKE